MRRVTREILHSYESILVGMIFKRAKEAPEDWSGEDGDEGRYGGGGCDDDHGYFEVENIQGWGY